MDPDVLGRVRHVHPRQSQPCKVEGYVLTFAHRGLPYLEPGFGTIEPLEQDPVPPTLIIQTSAQHSGAAQDGKITMYSTPSKSAAEQLLHKQTAQASGAHQAPQSPRPASSAQGAYGSPELPVSFGPSRSSAKRNRSDSVSQSPCDYEHTNFNLDGSHSLDSHASGGEPAVNGHKHVEVHGVVHLISQQDMAQICKTEGGGGAANHGYYVQHVPCHLYNGETLRALTLLTHPSSLLHQVSAHRSSRPAHQLFCLASNSLVLQSCHFLVQYRLVFYVLPATKFGMMCLQKEPALPSLRYLNILQRGAAHSQLAKEYQVYLQALQHYHASKPGQRIGMWMVQNVLGKPLKFVLLKVVPNVQNTFVLWVIHNMFHNLMLSMWILHNCLMEPMLGSGCHL